MVDALMNLMVRLVSVGLMVTAMIVLLGGGDRDSVLLLMIAGFVASNSVDIGHLKSRLDVAKETT